MLTRLISGVEEARNRNIDFPKRCFDMVILITYDVSTSSEGGQKRLRRVARACLDYGQRVQNSVFECKVNAAQLVGLKQRLLGIIDDQKDSLRFYNLGNEWKSRVEHHGAKATFDIEGPLVL